MAQGVRYEPLRTAAARDGLFRGPRSGPLNDQGRNWVRDSDWRARIAPAPQNRARVLAGAESAPTAPRCLGADLVQGKINSAVQVGGGQRVRNAPVGVQPFARANR